MSRIATQPSGFVAAEETRRARIVLREWRGSDVALGLERWRALEQRLPDVPLAASHTWTISWIRAYEGLVPYCVATLEAGGETVGACLIAEGVGQSAGPIPLRTRHVGTAGEPRGHSVCVEYNGLLVAEEHRAAFVRELLEGPLRLSAVDELRLDGWPADDLAVWSPGRAPDVIRLRECPYHDLSAARAAGGEPIERLGKSTRQNLRRLLRKYGDLETTWAESLDDADDIFRELVTLHQARWQAQGEPGAFASERFQRFQEQLILHGFGQGKVVLFRVRHAGETVGCLMLLADRGRLLDYLSGFSAFDAKPSPGLVSHYLCLTEAARRGYDAYDFLVGEKRHKQNLSTDSAQLAWAAWRGGTVRNKVVDFFRTAKRAADRTRSALRRRRPPAAAVGPSQHGETDG